MSKLAVRNYFYCISTCCFSTIWKSSFLFWMLMASSTPASSERIVGKVVGISDGDTIRILTPDMRIVILRLAEIDAPELKQSYGMAAKAALSGIIYGKQISASISDRDRYERLIAKIYFRRLYVNLEMVKLGAAWRYTRYSKDICFSTYELRARASNLGLWALPADQRIAPWLWRSTNKAHATESLDRIFSSSTVQDHTSWRDSCGSKRYCKQMTSCGEAEHFYKDCGIHSLDRDGDGRPCEALCSGR